MTTIAFSRRDGMIAADSRNTDSSGATFKVRKIERLENGRYFLGSGHLLTIGLAREWAESDFDEECRPEFGVLFCEQAEDFRFSCLVISEDGKIAILLDDEMHPQAVQDDLLAIGSGAAYAIGAMEAGLTPEDAVGIACKHDGNSAGPVQVEYIDVRPRLTPVN
jgi:ATP-dependent protease HslVU (ClpYQ) peptidase subunit